MPEISVIVPFHNEQKTILACIEGLLAQSYSANQTEIILVDNNSTDDSAQIASRHGRVRLTQESKPGSYAARNKGLGMASGRIIAFTDADCVPGENWLKKIIQVMENQEISIVVGAHNYAHQTFSLTAFASFMDERNRYIFNSKIPALYYGHTNNMAVRKELFDRFGPFIEQARGSDAAFVREVVSRSSCAVATYDSEIMVKHLEISGIASIFKKSFIYGRSRRITVHELARRSLNRKEQAHVLKNTIRKQRYTWLQSAGLLLLLSLDRIPWVLGSLAGLFNKSPLEPGQPPLK
jgi:glycosyltransferase involved in cell wall biosynthesis